MTAQPAGGRGDAPGDGGGAPGDAPNEDGTRPLPLTLALEGGGAMGAFAWGVLDTLLDTPTLRIAAVSGASAGAMNAALLVQGLATGGPGEAKRLLELFWRRVAVASGSLDVAASLWTTHLTDLMSTLVDGVRQHAMGQYRFNPLGLNPLRAVLDGLLDPNSFASPDAPMLVVSATRVRDGLPRLFVGPQVTAEVLLASACLPQIFPAVEIDGEAYWDGGYSSNPPLRPLIEAGAPPDLVVVRTTPMERPDVPATARRIIDRTTELAFGAALRHELHSVAVAQRLLADQPALTGVLARLRDARLHMVGADAEFRALPMASHLDATWSFLTEMRALGRRTADAWLMENLSSLGQRPTVDLRAYAAPLIGPVPDRPGG